jgi:hypothetical protein
VNSISFGWIVFDTIHSQLYLFWISKCKSNLKQQIFWCCVYSTDVCYHFFLRIFKHVSCIQKNWSHRSYLKPILPMLSLGLTKLILLNLDLGLGWAYHSFSETTEENATATATATSTILLNICGLLLLLLLNVRVPGKQKWRSRTGSLEEEGTGCDRSPTNTSGTGDEHTRWAGEPTWTTPSVRGLSLLSVSLPIALFSLLRPLLRRDYNVSRPIGLGFNSL